MSRIVILTSGPLCRNPRVLKEARTLGDAGHAVTVVTVAQHARFEAYDTELLRTAPFKKIALDRVSRGPVARLVSLFERTVAWALRRLKVQHPASLGPYHALLRLVRAQPADLIIVHTELPLCIGARLLALGRPVAADFEDWHSHDLLPEARAGRPLALLVRTEATLLREGRYASTTSLAMAHRLAVTYNSPLPVVIPNTFPLSTKPSIGPRGIPPAFFWFSQTIGPGRGIDRFLAAWRLTRVPSRLVLLGDVSADYRATLTASLPASRQTRLEFHPLVAPSELSAVIARHDIGLALEPAEPENKNLTTSNKLFQYLDAGVAVLATPTAGQREIMTRCPDAGIVNDLTDPVVLAANLDALLANPARIAAMGIAARAAAEREFSWEHTAPVLLGTISRVLAA